MISSCVMMQCLSLAWFAEAQRVIDERSRKADFRGQLCAGPPSDPLVESG